VIAHRGEQVSGRKALILPVIGVFALLLLPWIVHGVALSGCLAYPIASTCIPALPWSEDRTSAIELSRIIYSWARLPHIPPEQVLADWGWLKPWLADNLPARETVMLAILLIAGGLLLWRFRKWIAGSGTYIKWCSLLIGGLVLGSVYWFLTAPAIRFGMGYLFSVPLVIISVGLSINTRPEAEQPNFSRAQKTIFFLILLMTVFGLVLLVQASLMQLHHLASTPIMLLTDLDTIPATEVQARWTNSGDLLYVPMAGDQCWGATLPCTPYFNEKLQIIEYISSHLLIRDNARSLPAMK